ncbi:MAG TPA: helix-hairpin-helix domain-containing protein [Bellilinea sp.]|nr:helix-hairpin-helix domain-containing protein [Bellilinea sp.]
MYLVEYVGEATQFQRVRTSRRGYYRYGGPVGTSSRRFYVYPEDIHKFDSNAKFKVIATPESSIQTEVDTEPLPAETQEMPEARLLAAGLSPQVAAALMEAGYTDPDEVSNLSDEQLLNMKGIGAGRLSSIRSALP